MDTLAYFDRLLTLLRVRSGCGSVGLLMLLRVCSVFVVLTEVLSKAWLLEAPLLCIVSFSHSFLPCLSNPNAPKKKKQ